MGRREGSRPLGPAPPRGQALTGSPLGELLVGARPPVSGHSDLGIEDDTHEIVGSGFPGLQSLSGRPLRAQLDSYLERVVVTLSVRVYAQASEATVGHLRTKGGEREIDLLVARGDQRVVGIEVKLGRTVEDADVRHLTWLRDPARRRPARRRRGHDGARGVPAGGRDRRRARSAAGPLTGTEQGFTSWKQSRHYRVTT